MVKIAANKQLIQFAVGFR